MNYFTRIIGQNDKIYRKFGDYCLSETDNNTVIICAGCQEEFSEDSFWTHIQDLHNYPPSQSTTTTTTATTPTEHKYVQDDKSLVADSINVLTEQQGNQHENERLDSDRKRRKVERNPKSPIYVEAEYLENVDLNDPPQQLDFDESLSNFLAYNEYAKVNAPESHANSMEGGDLKGETTEYEPPSSHTSSTIRIARRQHKYIDVDRVSSKNLLNGKVLKRLFQQMQQTNNEFKYKINKLTQELKIVERELKKDVVRVRHNYMKIIPDTPFTTRDEVLILDEELHKSKEMRDCLHDEALLIMAQNAEVYSRILWRFIMTDEVAIQFCWRGVIDGDTVVKYPIKDLTIMSVFQDVFREKFPAQPINYFKERTMVYFNKAHERIKRNRMERKRTPKSEVDDNGVDSFSKHNRIDVDHFNGIEESLDGSIDDTFEEVYC